MSIALSVQLRAEPRVQTLALPKLVIVSDVDDSIRFSRVHHKGRAIQYWMGQLKQRAFTAMPALFNYLANKNIEVKYLSGTLKKFSFLPEKFLLISGFPTGEIHLRESREEDLADFKFREVAAMMRAQPEAHFILIGDNGQLDNLAYSRIQNDPEFSSRVKAVFIHKLYNDENAKELMAKQIPYFTSADLAAQLNVMSLITDIELREVAKTVEAGTKSKYAEIQLRTLPDLLKLSTRDLEDLKILKSSIADFETRDIMRSIEESIPMQIMFCKDLFFY